MLLRGWTNPVRWQEVCEDFLMRLVDLLEHRLPVRASRKIHFLLGEAVLDSVRVSSLMF